MLELKKKFKLIPALFLVEEILPLDTIITDPMKHSMNHPENSFQMRLVLELSECIWTYFLEVSVVHLLEDIIQNWALFWL